MSRDVLQQRTFEISAAAFLSVMLATTARGGEDSTPTIRVSGQAEVKVVPDQVNLGFGVESRAQQLDSAVAENDEKIAEVTKFLRGQGVPAKSIRTESLRIRPIESGSSKSKMKQQSADLFGPSSSASQRDGELELTPKGYSVQRQLTITLSEVNQFEQVYRGLIERGVNQVDSIGFSTTELREHRGKARIRAIRAAKEKAEALAGELGAKLAGVQSITESEYGRHDSIQNIFDGGPFGGSGDESGGLAAGELEITAAVNVVFRLKSTAFE